MAAEGYGTSFSLSVARMNGEPLAVEGLEAADPLSVLANRLCDALAVPQCHAASRLRLLLGEKRIVLSPYAPQLLQDVGIGPGALLTVLVTAESKVFEYHVKHEYDGAFAEDQSRLLLGSFCFLVRKRFDPNDCTGSENRPIQWDILYGSYTLEDGLAKCCWDVHLQRKIEWDLNLTQKLADSGWEKMDERASFAWRRLEVSDSSRTNLIDEKLASMTLAELEMAMQADMRANGVSEDEIYTNEDWCDGDDSEEESLEKLRKNLMRLYTGLGLALGYCTRVDSWSALIPGELLGPSPHWTRLPEYEEQLACGLDFLDCLDFSQSCLLGIKVTESINFEGDANALDLTDLPKLLGF